MKTLDEIKRIRGKGNPLHLYSPNEIQALITKAKIDNLNKYYQYFPSSKDMDRAYKEKDVDWFYEHIATIDTDMAWEIAQLKEGE